MAYKGKLFGYFCCCLDAILIPCHLLPLESICHRHTYYFFLGDLNCSEHITQISIINKKISKIFESPEGTWGYSKTGKVCHIGNICSYGLAIRKTIRDTPPSFKAFPRFKQSVLSDSNVISQSWTNKTAYKVPTLVKRMNAIWTICSCKHFEENERQSPSAVKISIVWYLTFQS